MSSSSEATIGTQHLIVSGGELSSSTGNERAQPSWLKFGSVLGMKDYALALGVGCYVVGFIVNNLYLGKYAMVNFDILRAKYILSGILFIMFDGLLLLGLYRSFFILSHLDRHSGKEMIRRVGKDLSIVLSIGLTVYLFISQIPTLPQAELVEMRFRGSEQQFFVFPREHNRSLLDGLRGKFFGSFVFSYISLVVFPYMAVIPLYVVLQTVRSFNRAHYGSQHKRTASCVHWIENAFLRAVGWVRDSILCNRVTSIVVATLLSFAVMVAYSRSVNELIPQQLGGGKPIPVQSVTVQDTNLMSALDPTTHNIYVVDRTPDSVIFRVDSLAPDLTDFERLVLASSRYFMESRAQELRSRLRVTAIEVKTSQIINISYGREPKVVTEYIGIRLTFEGTPSPQAIAAPTPPLLRSPLASPIG